MQEIDFDLQAQQRVVEQRVENEKNSKIKAVVLAVSLDFGFGQELLAGLYYDRMI